MTGLLRYLRQGDNAKLPPITEQDVGAPQQKQRKFSGEEFQDSAKQLSRKAFRIQKW